MPHKRTLWFILLVFPIFSLGACAHKPILYPKGATIAVWDLDDVSPSRGTQPDLGEPFSSKIIETLKEKGEYVVERDRLLLALEELRIGTENLADEDTRLELGKLVGARLMVFGGYQIIGDMMRVDLRLVDVESGKVLKAVKNMTSAVNLSGWLNAVGEAAVKLL
jgi:hypothetical protein